MWISSHGRALFPWQFQRIQQFPSQCSYQLLRVGTESLAPALLENLHPGTGRGLGLELGAMTFLPRVALAAHMLRDRPPPISHVSRRCFLLSPHTEGN